MNRFCSTLSICFLLTLLTSGRPLQAAQDSGAVNHPRSAVPGSTEERRAILDRLSPEQRQELLERSMSLGPAARSDVRPQLPEAKPEQGEPWVRGDLFGQAIRSLAPGARTSAGPLPLTHSKPTSKKGFSGTASSLVYSGADLDGDGLPNDFEDALGDAFTPVYHVSAGERGGTGFALFANSSSLSILQNLPAVPPVSYFRVTPVGFAYTTTGQQYGFLQIDYLSLWNRDDGLDIGGDCRFYASVLGGLTGFALTSLMDGLGGHAFDQERSAVLVAAPTTASFQYSSDPDTYQAYDYYIASHEGTFFDHSSFLSPSQPVPANYHLNLAFSRSKHASYTFNPDGLPLFPNWVIFSTYLTLDDLYYNYYIDDYEYLAYLAMADVVFYACVVEQFQEQGGWFSSPRINVGELSSPLNGSGFIHDPRVQSKLTPLIWRIQ